MKEIGKYLYVLYICNKKLIIMTYSYFTQTENLNTHTHAYVVADTFTLFPYIRIFGKHS
jgi:hypothetical protein